LPLFRDTTRLHVLEDAGPITQLHVERWRGHEALFA